jgi:hypothetical protein
VVARHRYRAVGVVLGVMAVCLFVSGMVGQHNDGPWGGLPSWVGAVGWFGFLLGIPVLLLLAAYLLATHLRARRTAR